MDVEQLTAIDFRILSYFRDHSPASIDNARKALPDIVEIEYRIKYMATYDTYRNAYFREYIPNTSCLKLNMRKATDSQTHITTHESLDTYSITTLGRKTLQDYEIAEKQRKKDMWLQNAKIPILVTIITNLVIDGTKWLLPLILQSLSNTP